MSGTKRYMEELDQMTSGAGRVCGYSQCGAALDYDGRGRPPEYCAEMVAFDASNGEVRTHYAGFFDSGFGYAPEGAAEPVHSRVQPLNTCAR